MKKGETYALECIEIFDAIRTNCLDGHHSFIDRPLEGLRNPPRDRDIVIGFSEAAVGDPVALRQKTTSGGHLLESTQTSTTEFGVVQ